MAGGSSFPTAPAIQSSSAATTRSARRLWSAAGGSAHTAVGGCPWGTGESSAAEGGDFPRVKPAWLPRVQAGLQECARLTRLGAETSHVRRAPPGRSPRPPAAARGKTAPRSGSTPACALITLSRPRSLSAESEGISSSDATRGRDGVGGAEAPLRPDLSSAASPDQQHAPSERHTGGAGLLNKLLHSCRK